MSISVVYVIANLDVGGAEKHLVQVVSRLNTSLIKPSVFTLLNKGGLAADLEAIGVPVIAPLRRYQGNKLNKLKKTVNLIYGAGSLFIHLRNNRPDIVHFFLPMPYLVGGFISLLAGVRIRVMSRRSLNHYQLNYPGVVLLERWLHGHMSYVLGNSKAVLNDLRDEGVSENKLGLIYNGVDIPVLQSVSDRDKLRQQIGVGSDDLLVIMVANLIPYKGHDDLLRGLANISMEIPRDWELICVGYDRHGIKSELELLSKQLGIAEYVRFIGGYDDVISLLQLSDVAVLCSHEEGFSNALLEGMAAGLPSVVTDVGGNAEAIRDGIDGYVVPPKAPDVLGIAISKLLNNEVLRQSMGRSANIRAQGGFSLVGCVRNYEQLYMNLVS